MIEFNHKYDKLAKAVYGIVLIPLTNAIKELTDFLKIPKSIKKILGKKQKKMLLLKQKKHLI